MDEDTAKGLGLLAGIGTLWAGAFALRSKGRFLMGPAFNMALGLAQRWGAIFGVAPSDILAIAGIESDYNPTSENHSPSVERVGGAWGMMQIIPGTAKALAHALDATGPDPQKIIPQDRSAIATVLAKFDPNDPNTLLYPDVSVMLGTYYLARLLHEFQEFDLAAAAYQQGPGAVRGKSLSELHPIAQDYAAKALSRRTRLVEQGVA